VPEEGLDRLAIQTAAALLLPVDAPNTLCSTAIVPGKVFGQLISVRGNVVIAGQVSFTPAASIPTALHMSDAILIGADGLATVVFGPSCQDTPLVASSSASVRQTGQCAYLVVEAKPPSGLPHAALFADLVGAGIAIYLIHHEEHPASP
jgi:hypothetical protein